MPEVAAMPSWAKKRKESSPDQSRLRVLGAGIRVWCLVFGVWCLVFRVSGLSIIAKI